MMNEEQWRCPKCKAELTVIRRSPTEWQSIRCLAGPVAHWQFNDETWWHMHEKGYTVCDKIERA